MSYCARCGAYIPQDEKNCLACGYRDTSASRFGSGAATQARASEENTYNTYNQYSNQEYHSENKGDKTVYDGEVVGSPESSKWQTNSQKSKGGATRRYSSGRTEEESFDYDFGSRETYRDFIDKDVLENKGMAALSYFGILFLIPLLTRKNSPFVRFHLNQAISLFLARVALWAFALFTGGLGAFLPAIGRIFTFGCAIAGIVAALGGKRKRLPIVGDFEVLK